MWHWWCRSLAAGSAETYLEWCHSSPLPKTGERAREEGLRANPRTHTQLHVRTIQNSVVDVCVCMYKCPLALVRWFTQTRPRPCATKRYPQAGSFAVKGSTLRMQEPHCQHM